MAKVLPRRFNIDRQMINNVRLCAYSQKENLEKRNIDIEKRHVDPSFITSYKGTNDKCIQGKSKD